MKDVQTKADSSLVNHNNGESVKLIIHKPQTQSKWNVSFVQIT